MRSEKKVCCARVRLRAGAKCWCEGRAKHAQVRLGPLPASAGSPDHARIYRASRPRILRCVHAPEIRPEVRPGANATVTAAGPAEGKDRHPRKFSAKSETFSGKSGPGAGAALPGQSSEGKANAFATAAGPAEGKDHWTSAPERFLATPVRRSPPVAPPATRTTGRPDRRGGRHGANTIGPLPRPRSARIRFLRAKKRPGAAVEKFPANSRPALVTGAAAASAAAAPVPPIPYWCNNMKPAAAAVVRRGRTARGFGFSGPGTGLALPGQNTGPKLSGIREPAQVRRVQGVGRS